MAISGTTVCTVYDCVVIVIIIFMPIVRANRISDDSAGIRACSRYCCYYLLLLSFLCKLLHFETVLTYVVLCFYLGRTAKGSATFDYVFGRIC